MDKRILATVALTVAIAVMVWAPVCGDSGAAAEEPSAEATGDTAQITIDGEVQEHPIGTVLGLAHQDDHPDEEFVGWFDGSALYTFLSWEGYTVYRDATITQVFVPFSYDYTENGDVLSVDVSSGFYSESVDRLLRNVGTATTLEITNGIGTISIDIGLLTPGSHLTVAMTEVEQLPGEDAGDVIGDGTALMVGAWIENMGAPHYLPYTADIGFTGSVVKVDGDGTSLSLDAVEGDGSTTVTDDGQVQAYYVFADAGGADNTMLYVGIVVVIVIIIVIVAVAYWYRRRKGGDSGEQ